MAGNAIDIAGIGASVFDFLIAADRFPSEDTKLKAGSSKIQGGGPCATALVAAAKLGAGAEYFGVLGTDFYGRYMLEEFRQYGVESSSVRVVDGGTSANSAVILNRAKGTRTVVWSPGLLPPVTPDDVPLEKLKKTKFLHLDGNHLDTAVWAAKKAREYGVKVSLDAGSAYHGIGELLPLVDILIPSEGFVRQWTGSPSAEEGAEQIFRQFRPEILAVTEGSRGGFLYNGETSTPYEAWPVEVVDTNGSGDVFHGAFLAGLIRGMPPLNAARFASAAAALKCACFGAREGIPSYEKVVKFVASY